MLKSKGFSPSEVTNLERLAIVGGSGMGALTYRPAWDVSAEAVLSDLDELAGKCQAILNREDICNLDDIFRMGGSSGGAALDFIKNFVTFLVITAGWPAVIKKLHI